MMSKDSAYDPGRRRAVKVIGLAAIAAIGLGSTSATQVGATTSPSPTGSAAGVPLTDGSMYRVVDQIGARDLWARGFTGRGVNVAVIDTGVAPVDALSGADKVVAMVDLSSEATIPQAEFRDTFGHGTHMAGIIAGRDPGARASTAAANPQWFMGVAPDAGIVSVKVGDNSGAVDVSQVIAGVDWVTDHARQLNIRVINLSYGSGSPLDYRSDPLSFAVERAWRAGIVVVVAAGNDGRGMKQVGTPANNPYVIAVAAAEPKNNTGWKVPSWATSGDGTRNPDVSAPGASIVSLRAPGSRADVEHPEGYVSPALFKGSGSSQAAAVTSGAVALLLSARPTLTPDQVKDLLRTTANGSVIAPRNDKFSGTGLLRLLPTLTAPVPTRVQTWSPATGTGSLDAARGGTRVMVNGTPLVGEVTVTGAVWNGARWTGARWTGGSWDGARWTGGTWLGARWTGARWTGARWTGATWSGARWTGARWTADAWTSTNWTGARWTGARWTDATWTSVQWDGARWTGARWTTGEWSGARWTGARWT